MDEPATVMHTAGGRRKRLGVGGRVGVPKRCSVGGGGGVARGRVVGQPRGAVNEGLESMITKAS